MGIINTNITGFYHPTKVVFLDDNQGFLDAIALELHDHELDVHLISSPDEAKQLIFNSNKNILGPEIIKEDGVSVDSDSTSLIHNKINVIYDPSRFDKIAVLVVDYSMPEINGIDFCKQLGNIPIFKILLTAEADSDIAINAFNDGLIDKFILKTHPNLIDKLKEYIGDLTSKYFANSSRDSLSTGDRLLNSLLNNELFSELFNSVLKNSNAVEYYLVDRLGSFLFLTKHGDPTWLLISSQENVDEQVNLLSDYNFPEDLIRKLKNKEKLLFLFSEKEHKEDLMEWKKYIYESKKLDDTYNYAVVSGRLISSITWDNVVPYQGPSL